MLVTSEPNSGPPSRTPSILDSPTLARVERARLRLEASKQGTREDSLERSILDPKYSFLAGKIPIESISGPIKRGLLWQQRDRLFSRWKERYFILTRDYLHCFKRASGSATERISDMGQFIFKVKLVDVEKVEWLNRRSYSAIGLFLGREGRVLLRSDLGLEDWFELLDECTQSSKERRRALRNIQGPRSRASLAAPPSHASLQSNHMGLGGTYSSALEDWLMTRQKTAHSMNGGSNHFPLMLSDSVPDLTGGNNFVNENTGISTNHSTPQRIPIHHKQLLLNNNTSRYSANAGAGYPLRQNCSYTSSGFCGTPLRKHQLQQQQQQQQYANKFVDEDEFDGDYVDGEVQLRRQNGGVGQGQRRCDNDKDEWMYRRPMGPTDMRHSLLTDIDISACDSGLDTPPSTTHRPASYRDVYYMKAGARDSTDTGVSSSRGTLVSPGGSFRVNNNGSANNTNLRHSVQEKVLRNRNEIDLQQAALRTAVAQKLAAAAAANALNQDSYDRNQNKYYRMNSAPQQLQQNGNNYSPQHYNIMQQQQQQQQQQIQHQQNGLNGNNGNGMSNGVGNGIQRERYQHPALTAIINESQGMKFRDRSYSDIQQQPRRSYNNNSPSPRRRPFVGGTPTRV